MTSGIVTAYKLNGHFHASNGHSRFKKLNVAPIKTGFRDSFRRLNEVIGLFCSKSMPINEVGIYIRLCGILRHKVCPRERVYVAQCQAVTKTRGVPKLGGFVP